MLREINTPVTSIMTYDISILSACDAKPWALYLQNRLSEEKYSCTVTVNTLSFGTLDETSSKEHKGAHVQVLILSPDFLKPFEETDRVDDLPDYCALFPRQCRTVVVFCGYDEDDGDMLELMSAHFRNFNKWAKCSAGQGTNDVSSLLVTIIGVLEGDISNGTDSGFPEDDIYSIPPEPRLLEQTTFKIVPEHIPMAGTRTYIIFNAFVTSPVEVRLDHNLQTDVIVQEENPFTFSFIIPENLPVLDSGSEHVVRVYSAGVEIGEGRINIDHQLDCLSRLMNGVLNPVDLLGQSMGIPNASQNIPTLDLKLKGIFQSNFPSLHLQEMFSVNSVEGQRGSKSTKETPTIIHFAAKFGLKELCAELLTCPGAAQCLTLENGNGDLPNDIAESAGHKDLATFLTDYMSTITMMHEQVVSIREKSVKEMPPEASRDTEAPADTDAPPRPCHGGSYLYSEEKRESIYLDMSIGKTDSIRESMVEKEQSVTTVSTVCQKSVESTTPDTQRGQEEGTLTLKPPTFNTPSPRPSSPRIMITSPASPHKSPTPHKSPPPHKSLSPSSSLSSINQESRASGSGKQPIPTPRESSSLQQFDAEESEKLRPNSESVVKFDIEEDRDMVPTLPPPFKPGPPIKAKDISSVSVTEMSAKDQDLRRILQSAAEGMVSFTEAKILVDNWDKQYRNQSSFKDRWKTINAIRSSVSDDPDATPTETPSKPNKMFSSFSKLFKKKTRSVSDVGPGKSSKKNSPTHGSTSSLFYNTNTVSEAACGRGSSSISPNNNNKETPSSSTTHQPLQRTKSIRISCAMQDKDISNLPELPPRSNLHGKKSTLSSPQGQVEAIGGSDRPPFQPRPESRKREPSAKQVFEFGSEGKHLSRTPGALSELQTSPRLPEPDSVPSARKSP